MAFEIESFQVWHPGEIPHERRQVGVRGPQREALELRTHRHQAVQLDTEFVRVLDREPA